ncbi:hydrolase [Caulobacter sp. CCUG 60055]|nr:hydrolase [Caulobacter sp. CCUG 60055]
MSLLGDVITPNRPRGLVIFAHGSGSSRFSPRNRKVAFALAAKGVATLLFDLLNADEAAFRANVFDVALLTSRLVEAIDWARETQRLGGLDIGLFGSSTGAAAALCAAARRPVAAVVSRGGRPDLAGALGPAAAPTLLIVGSRDVEVLALNRAALRQLGPAAHLAIVDGASHLFEEPGALDEVIGLSQAWFSHHFAAPASNQLKGRSV